MKKRFAVISVSALLALVSLSGCSTICPEPPVCEENPDDTGNPNDKPGGDNQEDPDDDTDNPVIEEPDPSEGLISKEDSPWSDDVTELMSTALGGGILPFIDLGEGEIDAKIVKNDEEENYRTYLDLIGGNFLASHLEDAISTYKGHYWEALMIGDDFYATNSLLNVQVEVSKNSNNLFELKAFYDEPFNAKDATEWDSLTTTLISEHFGRFEIPFVYLGTINYESTITEDGSLLVTGGTWNDQVISEFRSAFGEWTITTDELELTTLYATHEVEGNALSATISKVNNKAQLSVSLTEVFDSTNQTSWSSEVTKAMEQSLNKTILPYVYLGSVYPTIDTDNTNERNLALVGKIWDDSILTAAKTAFEADGWKSTSEEKSITFTKDSESESFEVVIGQNESGVPTLKASRSELYDESALTDYPDEIKTAFNDLYGEEMSVIPFIYLGTKFPTINNDVFSKHAETDLNKIAIVGGSYDSRILDQFKTKFTTENGWYSEVENTSSDSGTGYDSYGDIKAVALKSTGEYTYKVGLFTLGTGDSETAYLEINRSVNEGASITDWSDGSLSNIHKALGSDVKIPHFDTGRDTLEFVFDEYGHLSIQFSANSTTFSYRVFSIIYALTKDGWSISLTHNDTYYHNEAWINSIVATKEFGGKTIQISISINSSSYYRFAMFGSATAIESYDSSKLTGSWSSEISTAVKEKFKIDLPFIYLGTDNPYIYENEDDGTFRIIGNAYNEEIFTNAKTVLEANGFTYDAGESYGTTVVAYKDNSDGNKVTITVDTNDGVPYIGFELTTVFRPGSQTEWDETTKATLDKELPAGSELPYIYLGATDLSTSVETYNNVKKISIVGGNWDDDVLDLTVSTLKDTQFSAQKTTEGYYDTVVTGYDLLDNNQALRIKLLENDDEKIELDVYVDLIPEDAASEFASWESFPKYYGDSITDYMDQYLGARLPEFLPSVLTPEEDDVSLSGPYNPTNANKYFKLTSYDGYYSPYYAYVAMNKLKENGFEITFNPFLNETMPGLVAKKSDDKGTLMVTLGTYNGSFDDEYNGLQMSALYLPDSSNFTGRTDFENADKVNIEDALDGQDLPYVNLGVEYPDVSTDSGEVTLTAYNYSEEIIANIKEAYQNKGWTVYETYVLINGKAIKTVGGYLIANGHTYILTVTPEISEAMYGDGHFSSSSVSTEIKIEMA